MTTCPEPSDLSFVQGRDIAALQDPRPACIIGARSDSGEVCFATVIWVTPLSHNPEMVAFALREKSRTMEIIRETGCFSISVPFADEEGVRLVEYCGNTSGHRENKGERVAHTLVSFDVEAESDDGEAASQVKLVPVVAHAYSWEIGAVDHIERAGDHLLAVGSVMGAATCAPRNEGGALVPYGSLLCVQHGDYARATALER